MDEKQFRAYLQHVARKLFAGDGYELSENVGDWDSHLHVVLLDAIEAECGVSFSSQEVHAVRSIGALHAALQSKRAGESS